MRLTLLIADDEPLARRRLRSLAAKLPGVEIVGEVADGECALREVIRLRPDILILDIRMPEMSGIDVIAQLHGLAHVPAVIFATAYDEFAVRAFEFEAIDYLLKPLVRDRLIAALERARRSIEGAEARAALARAQRLLADPAPGEPINRLFVRTATGVLPIRADEISRVEAQDDYVLLHAGGRGHLASLRMRDLELCLPKPPFVRVHRSHIVNLDRVSHMIGAPDGRLTIEMVDGSRVPVSRHRSREIRRETS
jgi:two-component system LytT family response regulator